MEKENNKELDFNFDLPTIDVAPMSKPRLHFAGGDSVCVSCEG